ncbi:MAG: FliH/SctL family protein [Phycisphaerales bacterium]
MDLADLRAEGARLIAAARAESDRILREARSEAARLRASTIEQARAEGLEAGRAAGIEEGRAAGEAAARADVEASHAERLQAITAAWTRMLDEADAARTALMRDARRETIRLALGIASRVLRAELDANPELVTAQLEGALELIGDATSMAIACSERDQTILEHAMPELLDRLRRSTATSFIVDPALERGDVVLRVAGGTVDASIATQLDRIVEALLPGAGGEEAIP